MGAAVIAAFSAGMASGLALCWFWAVRSPEPSMQETHESGYTLINPLLACDRYAGPDGSGELVAFQDKIEEFVSDAKESGRATETAVYFRDLANGPWFGVNVEAEFSPASMLKVPVMMAWLKRAESDPAVLRRRLVYRGQDLNAGTNVRSATRIERGKSYTVDELMSFMIEHSDNNAQALLRAHLGPQDLAAIYYTVGARVAQVETGDFMTVRSYASFFRILYNATLLNRELSHKALTVLAQTDFHDGIAAGTPSTLIVAHKFGERAFSGSDERQLHDCGIVYYPRRHYLLCVMTRGRDLGLQAGVIADIARLVHGEVDDQTRLRE